jgi:plasmid maintenance system antidote protein VapI
LFKTVQSVARNINLYLEDNGYNKAEIARKVGISPNDFYAMLRHKKNMTADVFVDLCSVLKKSADYLANYSGQGIKMAG